MSITIQKVNDLTPTLTLMMMTVVVLHHQKGYHSQIDSHRTVLCLIAIGTYIAQLVGVFVRSVSQPRARILVYLNPQELPELFTTNMLSQHNIPSCRIQPFSTHHNESHHMTTVAAVRHHRHRQLSTTSTMPNLTSNQRAIALSRQVNDSTPDFTTTSKLHSSWLFPRI